ncbi:hypothetical protein OCU04_004661 [Sclerotinia nivalis]|nr:hypothetical protein OCU04_004661 [Sclerotinia nivalis]
MSRPPPFYPVIPIHMTQPNYQQQVDPGNPIVAGQTSQAPQAPQPTASDPTRWQVQNHVGAPAWISTHGGRFPKREPVANMRATRILHSNVKADINAKAASLRQSYPELIRYVNKPTDWDDLYYLWDAADIQMESPEFLYYVMHQLGEENEQLDRECELANDHEIDEYVQAWVTNKRELVLNCAAGRMYELFCSDPSENDDFSPELKLILNKTLEAHRLRLLRDASRNVVNATVPNLLQPNSVPQMSRSVSDNGNRLGQNRIIRPTISIATGSQSIIAQPDEVKSESHFPPLTQAQSTPSFHGGRNLSMPLNLQIQTQPASTKQEENMGLTSVVPHQLQTHNHVMEAQSGIVNGLNVSADLNLATDLNLAAGLNLGLNVSTGPGVSPARHNSYRNDNTFRNRPRPRENSIETPRNRRHQWTGPQGTHQNKFIHQSPHNRQQSISGSMRGSPSRVLQAEPIYVRTLEHSSGLVGDNLDQRMGNADFVGSRMELPSDVQKTFQHSKINQHPDLGEMEGDPKLLKTDTFCVYTYDTSTPRHSFGRTLYLKGPDLKMFHTNHLKNLMSTIGNVVSIKYLFRSYDSGPVFVTFDADVLAMAIEKFNGYRLPNGRSLTAGYPHENSRERSGSNSSYNSYHGDNHTRYMSASGSDNRAYSRRNSISQHRPSRSQSGQIPFRYFSGNHMTSGNVGEPFPHSNSPTRPYPAPYAPVAQQPSPGHALGAVISEVVQHERGIAHFQQMPLAVMNNRTNVAGIAHYRPYGGAQAEPHRVNTRFGTGPALPNLPNLPGNRKENSPIKQAFNGNTQFTPTRKHKKTSTSRQNTSTSTTPTVTPAATPAKSSSQAQLNNPTVEVVSLEALTSEVATAPTTGQLFTNETTAEPEAMNMEIIKEVAVAVPASPGPVDKSPSKLSSEQVVVGVSEPLSQAKTKNSKKNKKQFKFNSKVDIDKENNIVCSTPAILSPAESESTNPSLVGGDILFSEDSTRKPSVSSTESTSNNPLKKVTFKSQIVSDEAENPDEKEKTSAKALDNEMISAASVTSAPTPPNVPPANSSHKRSKTGGSTNDSLNKSRSASAKDLKKQPHSSNSDNCDSPTTATGSVRKTELKTAKSHGKTSRDGGTKFSEQQEQSKTDSSNKKRGLPEASQEKGKSSVSVVSNDSSEWPSLAPSKSPPSSITDGKPPQLPALPASTIRRTKEVISPALPLKPNRPS